MSYPFYLGYLHVCPQSMKREGVEVEYSRPGWGEDWPTTGHNVNAIIQRVVSAKQSDWTKVRSSHGDNSPSLTAYHQETWGSVTSSGLWIQLSPSAFLLYPYCLFSAASVSSSALSSRWRHTETWAAHVSDNIIWVTDQALVCAAYVKP